MTAGGKKISSEAQKRMMTGAQAVVSSLQAEDVDVIFGYPGGQVLDIYDALYDNDTIKHILVRHEQAAAHAADGYARATGKVGVVLVTSGPGATNTVTGIANAYMDSIPLVVIAGQVPTSSIGTDAFQEADFAGITLPITKHSYLLKDAKEIAPSFREAFHIARTGRPGPVVICIPSDVASSKVSFDYPDNINIISYRPTYKGNLRQIKQAANMIAKSTRPVIIAGGGIISSNASISLKNLSELMQIPVATSFMGRGAFPAGHYLNLGQAGMHGRPWANMALMESDLVIAVGTRFSDRITGDVSAFAKDAHIIHIDIDPAEIGKNLDVDIPIVGDAREVLSSLFSQLQKSEPEPSTFSWLERIDAWRADLKVNERDYGSNSIVACQVFEALDDIVADDNLIVTTEVGQHQMWAAAGLLDRGPRTFISSGGLGAMGFGFPAAMGAQVACPDALVVCIAGDGSIQMNIQEMATCTQYGLPVKVIIMDNGTLGMVRQMQELFYKKHYSCVDLLPLPDYVMLAKAYGWQGDKVDDPSELRAAVKKLLESKGPALLDIVIPEGEMAFPMVAPDTPLDKMIGVEDIKHPSATRKRG